MRISLNFEAQHISDLFSRSRKIIRPVWSGIHIAPYKSGGGKDESTRQVQPRHPDREELQDGRFRAGTRRKAALQRNGGVGRRKERHLGRAENGARLAERRRRRHQGGSEARRRRTRFVDE